MSSYVAALFGAGFGLGLWLIVLALRGHSVLSGPRRSAQVALSGRNLALAAGAGVAGLAAVAFTGWPVGGILVALAVLFAPTIVGGKAAREAAIARTEAIASWTEMIRDTIAAASGLEEAIVASAPRAPEPIRPEVRRLVTRLKHRSLVKSLVAFGDDVNHPSADLVVAALTIAARMEASDLSGLLSRLAESIRGEARMRIRVEVGRARVRTSGKVILGVVAATIVLLTTLSRGYLDAYDTATGQLALLVVGGIFALGGWLMHRMSRIDLPERFRARAPTRPEVDG